LLLKYLPYHIIPIIIGAYKTQNLLPSYYQGKVMFSSILYTETVINATIKDG